MEGSGHGLEGVRKGMKSINSLSPSHCLNLRLPEYKVGGCLQWLSAIAL
jgi:hypothetical protein